jgi:DNA-binding MarR family transcriptional regulator
MTGENMKLIFIENILFIERLHRRFLDVIKAELERLNIDDINNVQTLILYNISEDKMTISELANRGYYLGSNVSYNIKKLVEHGYLIQERSVHDKRAVKIRLSDKGLALCQKIDGFMSRSIGFLEGAGISAESLSETNKNLRHIERLLSDILGDMY